jgi:putative ABC transport system permease protein
MFRYFSLAFKNTFRNKRRSILTISSIAVSLCLFGVLVAMYHALFMSQPTPGQALRLVVRHKVSLTQAIPFSDEAKVRQIPGVKEISVWNWYGGTYKDSRDPANFFARLGVEPKPFLTIRTDLKMPEEQRRAFLTDRTGCIISRDLSEKLKMKLGDRVVLKGDIYPYDLDMKIVGIFDDPDATQVLFFNWEYLRDLLPVGRRSMIGTMAILVNTTDDSPKVAKAIDAMFGESPYPTKTESEGQFALSFVSFLGNIKLFLMIICAAVTFTILLVSGNTMAMSVRERIKEVGVLKTLGFNNDAILGMIVGEAICISLIGGAIGLFFASILTVGVGKAAGGTIPQLHTLSIDLFTTLVAMGLALVVGVVSSFVPAWNAAKTNILDSLRYSG